MNRGQSRRIVPGLIGGVLLLGVGLLLGLPRFAAAGPLTINPSEPKWFYRDAAPFFFCGPGDPENFLHRGTLNANGTRNGDQQTILDLLSGTGANTLWMAAVRSHGGDGGSTENPFVNHNPAQGLDQDVLAQWEGWIEQLDAAGIVTFFVFYDDGSLVWNTGDTVGAQEASFVSTIVNRFEHVDRLVWCVAEEYEEALSESRVSALAAIISAEDGHGHPVATHQLPGVSFDFPNDAHLDSHAMQIGAGATRGIVHDSVVDAWELANGQYNVTMAEAVGHYSDRTTSRRLCWAAAFGGASVMVQAMDVIDTPVAALQDCGRLVSFFQALPLRTMEPRDDLKSAQTEYVFGAVGAGFALYSSNLTGSLGLILPAGAGGNYDLRWMDCVTGATSVQLNVPLAPGTRTWPKPSGIGSEAALSLVLTSSTDGEVSIESTSWGRIKGFFASDASGGTAP